MQRNSLLISQLKKTEGNLVISLSSEAFQADQNNNLLGTESQRNHKTVLHITSPELWLQNIVLKIIIFMNDIS